MRVVAEGPDAAGPQPRGFFARWGKPLLVASLALNLVTVGLIAGAKMRERRMWHAIGLAGAPGSEGRASAVAQLGSLAFVETLPKERRDSLLGAAKERWEAVKALRREARGARVELVRLMDTEPFDQSGAKAKAERIVEAESKARAAFHALLIEIVNGMTPDERELYKVWRQKFRHPGAPGHGPRGAGGL
ncbi:MAG TPA: periplasmic heavy metal sensor [Hyphomicrobiaceae bacterium]|nr:periplasmic heavy metal sensor [Hyphomicrobiaceae bacterium]